MYSCPQSSVNATTQIFSPILYHTPGESGLKLNILSGHYIMLSVYYTLNLPYLGCLYNYHNAFFSHYLHTYICTYIYNSKAVPENVIYRQSQVHVCSYMHVYYGDRAT